MNELNENFLLNGIGNPLKTSDKFRGGASQDMINHFTDIGYQVRSISKPKAHIKENLPFNKHMIRLVKNESMEIINARRVDESFPEIVIVNNNNNRGSLQVLLGIFRLVCSNGMILGDTIFNEKVRHDSHFDENLRVVLNEAANSYGQTNHIITELKNKKLEFNEMLDFKNLVVNDIVRPQLLKETTTKLDIVRPSLLKTTTTKLDIKTSFNPVRNEDMFQDAWTIFNRLQEFIVRRGIQYSRLDEIKNDKGELEIKLTNGTTREIKGIDRNIKINQDLMNLTLNHFNISA